MHGIVHKTLKSYVIEKADEAAWETILERAAVEPKLYLPVSHYPDAEVAGILQTLSALSGHAPETIERDFGRALAPALLSTFSAHLTGCDDLVAVLDSLEGVSADLADHDDLSPPRLTCSFDGGGSGSDGDVAVVTYDSERDHCAMAHGILEGIVAEYGADATVAKTGCVRDGETACTFRVGLN
ncbi:heme NO-binding domain-containing protein [Natrialbaceae archaeon GCM10025810]|uniref:heme NO-binding domain-containing protein n=1 Tax=Halovalidus salilacus TaxID=3075124 RepID=UPI003614A9B1